MPESCGTRLHNKACRCSPVSLNRPCFKAHSELGIIAAVSMTWHSVLPPINADAMISDDAMRRRWRQSHRVTALLLLIWFLVSFGVPYFARELSGSMLGWPFSFWVGAEGALLIYLVLVWSYAWLMHRVDVEHDLAEVD
jgi:putative solute:sodium symporter small subunit